MCETTMVYTRLQLTHQQAARMNGTAVDWSKEAFRWVWVVNACQSTNPRIDDHCRRDGLDALQAAWDAQQQRAAPTKAAGTRRRVQSAAPAPTVVAHQQQPHIGYLVSLLATCEVATLAAIQQASGTQQLRLLYRALRSSRFLCAMEEDLRQRERKLEEMVAQSFQPQRRVLSEEEAEGFLQRLLADAAKRQARCELLAPHNPHTSQPQRIAGTNFNVPRCTLINLYTT